MSGSPTDTPGDRDLRAADTEAGDLEWATEPAAIPAAPRGISRHAIEDGLGDTPEMLAFRRAAAAR